jgi:tryptophan synthase alpha chain
MAITFTHKPGLVAYVTCGAPDLPTTKEVILAAVRSGADVIELGVPFSDPVADGPVIQRACDRALRRGTTLEHVLHLAREVRTQTDAGLIIFSYLNPLLKFGLARFCAAAEEAGIDGALVTDLPVEEAGEYLRLMRSRSLATVFLVAPTSTDERLKRIAEVSTGFVYAVSRTGVTGARAEFPADSRELVARIRRFTQLPIAVGFGISTPGQFAAVGQYAEAAVVGSALMQAIENSADNPAEAVAELIVTLRKQQATSNKLQATSK